MNVYMHVFFWYIGANLFGHFFVHIKRKHDLSNKIIQMVEVAVWSLSRTIYIYVKYTRVNMKTQTHAHVVRMCGCVPSTQQPPHGVYAVRASYNQITIKV